MLTRRKANGSTHAKQSDQRSRSREQVEALLALTAEDAQLAKEALAQKELEQRQLTLANEKQALTIAGYRERLAQQEQALAAQQQEISELGAQLALYRNENITQSERIALQSVQLSRLQSRIANQDEQLSMLESQNTDELRAQAMQKAEEIVARAIADSDRILVQATEQRARLIAACRAAYYSALQFKQDLAEQFRNMERELDASIDVLQFMDNTRLSMSHAGDVGEPAAGSQTP